MTVSDSAADQQTSLTPTGPSPRTAAFFDLDKTIIAKSSTLAFSKPFFAQGLINRRAVLKSSYAQFLFLLSGADHAFRLTGNALPAWTTRTPTAAATRSSSSRNAGSASTARIPRTSVIAIGPPCRCGVRAASRAAGFVDNIRSVHKPPTAVKLRICPTKGTTPARGGGGEGRRESAPGGRADTPSAKPSDTYYTHESVSERKGCFRKMHTISK